jgi:hypothetical protein
MITREEIEAIGFNYSEELSTDEVEVYSYIKIRKDKPKGTQNVYMLCRAIGIDYFNLTSDLQRLSEFQMFTRGYNGYLDDISELFYIFESFKSDNRKI